MSQLQNGYLPYNASTVAPFYNYANIPQQQINNVQPSQQTVSVSSPANSQVYTYPQTSVYNDPNKQQASGVNIYIYNPSAIGGPSSNSSANATYTTPGQQTQAVPAQPIANTPISNEEKPALEENKKTKRVVELTDDYIKTLESYLRSSDNSVRQTGIKELIKRFEEDKSRYDDEALTALLNIALQDPDPSNRLFAMSVISSGGAHGDKNTISILKELQKSDKLYGREADMANGALLKAVQNTKLVPDDTPEKK